MAWSYSMSEWINSLVMPDDVFAVTSETAWNTLELNV